MPNRLPTSSNEKSLLLAARVVILDVDCCGIQCHDTVDGRNPKQPPSICKKSVNDGINYQPQLVIAGFLNHQQYVMLRCSFFFLSCAMFHDVLTNFRKSLWLEGLNRVRRYI